MNVLTKDRYFKETVEQLKEWGFEVYSPAHIFKDTFRYGWVTDGVHILYFEINDLEGLRWSTECIPSHETGCGKRIECEFSKEAILNAFKISFGQLYSNFEHFRKHHKKWSDLIKI